MGFRRAVALAEAASALSIVPSPATPETIPAAVAEAFGVGGSYDRVTRTEAMSIPAMRRARNTIVTIATFPLVATTANGPAIGDELATRRLVETLDPNLPPAVTLAWTLDDLLFYGRSWWRVTDRDWTTYPTAVERITRDRVTVTGGVVRVDGEPVPHRDVIRFDALDEGLLVGEGARSLRTCLLLEDAARRNARQDVPLGALRPKEGAKELSTLPNTAPDGSARSAVEYLLDSWEESRRKRTTAWLNGAIEYETLAHNAQEVQLAEARAFQAAEVARLTNMPTQSLNAPTGDSMTYSTVEGARRDLVDITFATYMTAIGQRLSMGDVTPRGWAVRLDPTAFLRGDAQTAMTTATAGVAGGVITPEEARPRFLGLPAEPTAGQLRAAPANTPEESNA